MQQELNTAFEMIRPVLQQDGGDIEFVGMSDDATVQVRLTGRCKGCPKSEQTLKNIVAKTIIKLVPGVRRVEAVQ